MWVERSDRWVGVAYVSDIKSAHWGVVCCISVFIVRIVFLCVSVDSSTSHWALLVCFKSSAMASLASEAHSFLHQLLCSDIDKQEDALISEWDDELAEHHPHEGYVLLTKGPIQKLINCITYETITLSGSLCILFKCVLCMLLLDFCVMGRLTRRVVVFNCRPQHAMGIGLRHQWFWLIYEPTGEQEPQLLEDLFTMHVHDHQQHGLVIRTKTQAVTVAELLTNFDSVSMTVTFGRNQKVWSLSGAHLQWPRGPGCAVLISLKDVYTVLGLQQFGGQSWRWINSGIRAWMGWMAKAGYLAHVVPSHKQTRVSVSDVVRQKVSKCKLYAS